MTAEEPRHDAAERAGQGEAPRPSTPEEIEGLPDDMGNRGERDANAEEAADANEQRQG